MSGLERDSRQGGDDVKIPTIRPGSHPSIVYAWHQTGISETEMPKQGILDGEQVRRAYRRLVHVGLIDTDPRPVSNTAIVLEAIHNGVARSEVSESTGLDRKKVNAAVGQLKKVGGRLERGSEEESRALKREVALVIKRSIWPEIEEYAFLGLTPREIKVAAEIEKKKDYSTSKIDNTVWAQRSRKKDERLERTPEDEKDARAVTYEPDQSLEERMKALLVLKTLLEASGMQIPVNRTKWQSLLKVLRGGNKVEYENQDMQDMEETITIVKSPRTDIVYQELTTQWSPSRYRAWKKHIQKNGLPRDDEFDSFFPNERMIFSLLKRSIPIVSVARISRISKEGVAKYLSLFIETGRMEEANRGDIFTSDEMEEDENIIAFVRELIRRGFITENVLYWERLHQLYAHYERALPDSILEQIKLEAFFSASLNAGVGNVKIYGAYRRAALEVLHGFVKGEEEQFVEDVIHRAKRSYL